MRFFLISIPFISIALAAPFNEDALMDLSYADYDSQDTIVPMVVLNEADLPPVSSRSARPSIQRNQNLIGLDSTQKPYQHMGMGIGYIKVAPLLPQDQAEFGFQREQWVASFLAQEEDTVAQNETRKLRQMVAQSDKGETTTVDVPEYDNKSVVSAVVHKLSDQVDKVYPEGVSEKKLVGVDQDGLMRFMNVPHYDRNDPLVKQENHV
ncbi:hypothetical protein BD560DRAFT_427526 [Blakeslea trispora]|nr:hypothetical protein BD560DRAFT_427526 [Blakeslea trispora]